MDAILCGAPLCQRPAQIDVGPYCTYHLEHPPPPEPNAPGASTAPIPTVLDHDTVVWLALATQSDLEQADAIEQVRSLSREVLALRDDRDRLAAEVERLRGALEPFASGVDWGTIKAWIVVGSEAATGDRALGVKVVAQLTRWQVNVDAALAALRGQP